MTTPSSQKPLNPAFILRKQRRRKRHEHKPCTERLGECRLLTAELKPNHTFDRASTPAFRDLGGRLMRGTTRGRLLTGQDLDHFGFQLGPGKRFERFVGLKDAPTFQSSTAAGIEVHHSDGEPIVTSDGGSDMKPVTSTTNRLSNRMASTTMIANVMQPGVCSLASRSRISSEG